MDTGILKFQCWRVFSHLTPIKNIFSYIYQLGKSYIHDYYNPFSYFFSARIIVIIIVMKKITISSIVIGLKNS